MSTSYKATIFRKGAEPENLYGTNPVNLARRAKKLLNQVMWSTESQKAVVYRQVKKLDGNSALWEPVETILPEKAA